MKTINKSLKIFGLITLLVVAFGLFLASNASAAAYCNSDSDCGTNGYIGSQSCQGSTLYQTYVTWSCRGAGSTSGYCVSSRANQAIGGCTGSYNSNYNYGYNYNTCTFHAFQRCTGSYLYWYDSCGNQQDLAQHCSNGCSANSNTCIANNYGCYAHANKTCVGNNVFWYDSCGNQQEILATCTSGLTCQLGQCVLSSQTNQYTQPTQTTSGYIAHNNTTCYNNSLYWYDSKGAFSGLAKSCVDTNSCTSDTCSGDQCSNTLKCDGSTCAAGSADYITYCQPAQTNSNVPTANGLSISLFTKQDSNQWQKTAQVPSNGPVYFMISAVNNSAAQIDNINVSANIPSEISSIQNLQLNGVPISGNIASGINIGSLIPAGVKSITFEGKAQTISGALTKQVTVTSNISGKTQSDSISMNLTPDIAVASVSGAAATTGFWGFLTHWYLWILGAFILVVLFIIVFKRLSSEA